MELSYFLNALLRRKGVIILCFLVAVVSAFIFTLRQKKLYESTSQFSTGFTVSEELKLSNESFNLPQIDLKFNNIIENITSPKVLSLLSYRLLLHDLESKTPFTPLPGWAAASKGQSIDSKRAVEILKSKLDSNEILSSTVPEEKELLHIITQYGYDLESLGDMIKVTRFQKTDYVNITCNSEDPFLSAFIVNDLLFEFKRFYELDKRGRSDVPLAALDSIANQKKRILDEKSQAKSKFMSDAGVVDVTLSGSSALSQKNNFENQLIEEQAAYEIASYRVMQMDSLIKDAEKKGVNVVIAPTSISSSPDRSQYTDLRRQYNDLYTEFLQKGGKDPDIRKKLDVLIQNMAQLNLADSSSTSTSANGEVTLSQLIQKRIDGQGQARASAQKIASLQQKLKDLNGGLNGMAATSANIQQLDKEVELASNEYKDAKEKLNQAMNMKETSPGNFVQTLYGQPALKPQSSKRAMIIALSGAIAVFLASLVIVMREFFDQSIKTPSHFQRISNLPVLGIVNKTEFVNSNVLERTLNNSESRNNIFEELLRKLRYELENSGKKIFLVTSTRPAQGKTTLIQALAHSLSLGKKRVLIIDTNFCNNDLTTSMSANPILQEFNLNGKSFDISDAKPYITHTKISGVDIIGCKGGDFTPSEVLPQNNLLNYLDSVLGQYDFIFLEGAPLNSFTDTKELLKYADALIAIFSAEIVLSTADKESIIYLEENRDKFLGAILNRVSDANLEM